MSSEAAILYLKERVLFPSSSMTIRLPLGDTPESFYAVDTLLAFPLRNALDRIFYKNRIAVLAEIQDREDVPNEEAFTLHLKGIRRVRIEQKVGTHRALYYPEELPKEDPHLTPVDLLRKKAQELIFLLNSDESDRLISLLNYLSEPSQLADFVANYFLRSRSVQFKLLYEKLPSRRAVILMKEIERMIRKLNKQQDTTII